MSLFFVKIILKDGILSCCHAKNGSFSRFICTVKKIYLYLYSKSFTIKYYLTMSKFIDEFKAFAVKGNAIDMAVGVIVGGAFGQIVNSIVNDIIMPPLGWLIGGVNFTDLKLELPAKEIAEGVTLAPATIAYGNFIQVCINFIIIALCVFMMVKGINKLSAKKVEEPAAPAPEPEPSAEEKLLTEIRDLLKNK